MPSIFPSKINCIHFFLFLIFYYKHLLFHFLSPSPPTHLSFWFSFKFMAFSLVDCCYRHGGGGTEKERERFLNGVCSAHIKLLVCVFRNDHLPFIFKNPNHLFNVVLYIFIFECLLFIILLRLL